MVLADASGPDGLKAIDLGVGHSSSGENLCGRVVAALKSSALLNDSIGARYLARNWPPALKAGGAWPLVSLRQSFLDGSLTRLIDPDAVLRRKVVEWVGDGEFGLGSGRGADGRFEHVSFQETVAAEDVMFEADVYLLTRTAAESAKATPEPDPGPAESQPGAAAVTGGLFTPAASQEAAPTPRPPAPSEPPADHTIRVHGKIPAETWNRVGARLLPKLRGNSGRDLQVTVSFELTAGAPGADALLADLRRIVDDLRLDGSLRIDTDA